MTGFNMVMPGNTAEAAVSPEVKSLVEKSLPNKKGDFFKQLKKVQDTPVKGLSFTGKYDSVNENSKIITSGLGTATSNNVNESYKILSEQLCEGDTPETIAGNSSDSRLLGAGSIPVQDMTPVKVASLQNEAMVLANATKQTGGLESSPDISQDKFQQQPAWVKQSNYPEQVAPEEDSGQVVVAKRSNTAIDGIVLDGDSSNQAALSGDSIELSKTELEKHPQVFKPLESTPDSRSEPGRQLKGVAGTENQLGAQVTIKTGTAQPEPTNNTYNQQGSKGPDAGHLKLDPPPVQTGSQDSLASAQRSEEVIDSQAPVEHSEKVAPIWTNPEPNLEVLKPLESTPDSQSELGRQLKGIAGTENHLGVQVTIEPGTAQPEPTNNNYNQQDSTGSGAGQLKLDPPVMQTSNQNSLALAQRAVIDTQAAVEGSGEVVAKGANSAEVLKPIEPIPDTESGKQSKAATGYENGLATKTAGNEMDIQPSVEVDVSSNLSQQAAISSTIAGTRETESGKGKTTSLVDKQVEVDLRATPERPLVQSSRVNHSPNTSHPGFEPTANDEAGENADATRKESPSVDVKKLIEFESHRLRGTKLNTFEGSRENLFSEDGDETRPNLNVLNRSDLEWLRSPTRNPGMETGGRFVTDTKEIIDQVVKNAELLLRANGSELKIELKPEFLGRLIIKVALEDGAVIARLITENQQVKHMLESNLTSLKQSLESQGIKVDRVEVSVQLNNGGMFDGSEDNRQYLWQEHQHSQQHPGKYWGDGVYNNEALEIMEPEGVAAGPNYGINENGNLNFLI